MNQHQILELCYASLTVIITIVIVLGLKVYGNLPVDNIGPELNLLTYGFLWDTILQAITTGNYWSRFPPNMVEFKHIFLITIIVVNIILMAVNFKLSHKVAMPAGAPNKWLKPRSYFLGIVSLMIFLALKIYVD